MFDKIKNRLAWEKIYSDQTIPISFKQAIRSMFIPYDINIEQFWINCDCIENCKERDGNGRLASKSVLATVRDLQYKYSCINCSDMPIWYYMAFPDVFLWTISDDPQVKTLLNNLETRYGANNFLDASGEVKLPIVNEFVEAYIKKSGLKLECSIR